MLSVPARAWTSDRLSSKALNPQKKSTDLEAEGNLSCSLRPLNHCRVNLMTLSPMPTEVQLVCCMTFVCFDFIKHVHHDPVKFVSSNSWIGNT